MGNNQLKVEIALQNEKVKFFAYAGDNNPINIDYIAPIGDGEGYTSLELLLISLSTCLSTSVLLLLRKQKKEIHNCYMTSYGTRREIHPTYLEDITLELKIISPDVLMEDINQAISLSESTICPVINMFKEDIKIKIVPTIHRPEA